MQQGITRRDVYEPSLTATVDGRGVEVSAVSMDRGLPDPLAGDQLRSASGTVTAVEGPDGAIAVATPWDPGTAWPPAPQAPASLAMDTGSGPVSLLSGGRVVSARGGTSGREVEVEVADRYESLNRTISWDAVAAAMPPHNESWDDRRYVNMHGVSVADMILRHCGWYSTPPRLPWAALSIPGVGTMWPENGLCTSAHGFTSAFPDWYNAPWGIGVSDFVGTYDFGDYTLRGRGHIEMVALSTAPADYSRINLYSPSGTGLARLTWTADEAYIEVRAPGGGYSTAVRAPRSNGLVYGTISYVTDTSVYCIIRSGGASHGASASVDPALTTGVASAAEIRLSGPAGGLQVAFPSRAGELEGWIPNARIFPRTGNRNHLQVRRSESGVNCADYLQKLCEAQCATYWIDETGVLQWWDIARLESRTSVVTLESSDDISDAGFEWSHSLSSVRSRVSVKWVEPLRHWSAHTSVDLYQGNGSTVQPGEGAQEDWINTPDDEIWVMTETRIYRAGTDDMDRFNRARGSWYGAIVRRPSDGVEEWAQQSGSFLMTVERVTDRSFKTWVQWTGSEQAVQRTPEGMTTGAMWALRRDFNLPVLRGKANFKLSERVTYSSQTGPATAPEHSIDVGWLIQDAAQAQYVADYYGARATVPQPVLSSIALIPVPGLQLGDVVTVRDEHVTRLTIRGIVIEDSRSINADMDMRHAVAIRPTYVAHSGGTWADWGSLVGDQQHQTWGQRQQSDTWQTWGHDPLEEE